MEELTEKEKAKRYDEAIEKAKYYYDEGKTLEYANDIVSDIFPELKESEDEKIRKEITTFVKSRLAGFPECDRFIDWLESQGEHKPDDKVEPKFHEGDWVVFNNKHQSIYQVEKIEDGYYILRHTHGGTFRVCVLHDESLRLWTIQDSKNGDVLAVEPGNDYPSPFIAIYKERGLDFFNSHCFVAFDGKFYVGGNGHSTEDIHPATKEQRDTLEKAITNAGYEWSDKDRKLIKIVR